MLSKEYLEKYRMLHKQHFGTEISREEAYEQGGKLACLIKLIYKTITKEQDD